MTSAEYRAPSAPKTPATGPRNAPAPSPKGKTQPAPREPVTAQIAATLGEPGVQLWKGTDQQGSVLRFFSLSPDDREALLAFAATRNIHPVRR
jgi:hypothetical protein